MKEKKGEGIWRMRRENYKNNHQRLKSVDSVPGTVTSRRQWAIERS